MEENKNETKQVSTNVVEEPKHIGFKEVCDVCYMNESCDARSDGMESAKEGLSPRTHCPRNVYRELNAVADREVERMADKKLPIPPMIGLNVLFECIRKAYEIAKRPADAVKNIKLYSAYSICDQFAGRENVRLDWYYLERKEPIGFYEELIEGFHSFDKELKIEAARTVDELFTEDEIIKLGKYLGHFSGETFVIEEISLPIWSKDNPDSMISHGRNREVGTLTGNYIPFKSVTRDCPVPIFSSFNLTNTKVTGEVGKKADDYACYILQKVMTAQGIDPSFMEEVIEKKIGCFYDIYEHHKHSAEVFLSEINLQKMICTYRPAMWQNYISRYFG